MEYQRDKAVAYAHRWAYRRNPAYYDFSDLGGDCTNFTSQCLYAGSSIMNYTPTFGWFYLSLQNRAPAWTGVNELFRFLTNNQGAGPYAQEVSLDLIEAGDVIQLSFDGERFAHSPFVVDAGERTPSTILVAAHTNDTDNRPLSTYLFRKLRPLHIIGVRA